MGRAATRKAVPGFTAALVLLAGCGLARGENRADVPAGTSLTLGLEQTLNSERHGPGHTFTATVTDPVTGEGEVLIPAGARVEGEVLHFSEDPPRLELAFREIEVRGETHDLEAELVGVTPRRHSEMTDEGVKIGGGAAAGALLGGLIGGDVKGAVIGAAAGAAAGTGVALATKESHAYLPAGTRLRLRLDEALRVKLAEGDEEEPSGEEGDRG